MKISVASLFLSAALLTAPALAQDKARPYDNGPVWVVSFVQTKPGHFDDYMRFIDTTWKAEQDAMKKKGWVLDYKVLNATDARDNEADLYLMVEYKNMAAFDVPLDDIDAMTRKLFGSMTAAQKANIDRESIRTLRGDLMVRELVLK